MSIGIEKIIHRQLLIDHMVLKDLKMMQYDSVGNAGAKSSWLVRRFERELGMRQRRA